MRCCRVPPTSSRSPRRCSILPIVSGRCNEVSDHEIHGKSHLLTNTRVKSSQVRERCPPLVVSCAVAQSYKSITSDPAPTQASPRPSCPNGATGAASSPPLTDGG